MGRRNAPEITTSWFKLDAIPFDLMPADDAIWYPAILEGKRLTGRFRFNRDVLEEHSIQERGGDDGMPQ
jgi:hypothetical protein